jgi:NAD(P)-dependent dehydrogenase (short-subunit alcohol dehydrogenase family)
MSNATERTPTSFPPQEQAKHPGTYKNFPLHLRTIGLEHQMNPEPAYDAPWYKGTGKLQDKVALITGGDSGIGRSVAILYAREGCHVAISYLDEHKDAEKTKQLVEKEGRRCLLLPGDVSSHEHCKNMMGQVIQQFGKINILVNNAAIQIACEKFEDLKPENLEKTFKTNIFSFFYLSQAAIPHMKEGDSIINTTSVNAYKGHKTLLDYTSTKGAITAFTYALATNLMERGIRVNGVAPGPIWYPINCRIVN